MEFCHDTPSCTGATLSASPPSLLEAWGPVLTVRGKIRSAMRMKTPIRARMELTMFMPMLAFTWRRQGVERGESEAGVMETPRSRRKESPGQQGDGSAEWQAGLAHVQGGKKFFTRCAKSM